MGTHPDPIHKGEAKLLKVEALKDDALFKELEMSLGFHNFCFSDIEDVSNPNKI